MCHIYYYDTLLFMMNPNTYFRAGAGAIIYDQERQIYIFRRSSPDIIWQFPQGGIDAGESPIETLWRELKEETGLTKESVLKVTPYPGLLYYEYDQIKKPPTIDPNCLGQIHYWYFLEVKSGTVIDLEQAHDEEFSESKLATFPQLIAMSDPLKGHVYEALAHFFSTKL
jgi:putative (di)nucleoside polyphosphate hydrolase